MNADDYKLIQQEAERNRAETARIQARVDEWTPPEVVIGETVLVYLNKSDPSPQLARVSRIKPRTIDVIMDGARPIPIPEIYHKDDLKTEMRPEVMQAAGGRTWGQSPWSIMVRKAVEDVAALRTQLDGALTSRGRGKQQDVS